jgi:cellulose synthase/poly-beta-1,6-N-acetylglucosamine synthase-like glycosyltransferase
LLFGIYLAAALVLLLFGLNCYVLVYLFARRRGDAARERAAVRARVGDLSLRVDAPFVTTQLPIFNELNVAERVIEAACALRYAPGRHEVQVLDDSTDETRALVDQVVDRLQTAGHDIRVVRRDDRAGFKAGALAHGMTSARGTLFAIFDADFVPEPDFLLRSLPFFQERPDIGLVQCRWGHLNREHSLLTRAQAMGIDGHFMVEQSARAWNGLVLNFNGTAGIWRREAIESAGGWQGDTLTEDLDLSYRARLAGWQATYLPDVVVPAEIPEDVNAFKSQQFRWAKGSMQTAIKLLPRVFASPLPAFTKLQAMLHLTHYVVHPLMLVLATLSLPVLLGLQAAVSPGAYVGMGLLLLAAMLAPNTMYVVSQRSAYPDWLRRVALLPALSILGVGTAISNTRAVIEAIVGRPSAFVRTPKRGERTAKEYRVRLPGVAVAEVAMGLYCLVSLMTYLSQAKYLVGPFLAVYTLGFTSVGWLSLHHARSRS